MKKVLLMLCAGIMFNMAGCTNGSSGADKGAKTVDDVFASSSKDTSGDIQTSAQTSSSSAETTASSESPQAGASYDKVDTDLSVMSDTMAYAEFTNILNAPDKYKGKTIKAKGTFAVAQENGNTYFACKGGNNETTQICQPAARSRWSSCLRMRHANTLRTTLLLTRR